jgi:uncharacterized protein
VRAAWSSGSDGIRLAVRLAPRASADRVLGVVADAAGGLALKVAVTAPPADGKANLALLRLLAKLFDVAPSRLSLLQGASDRRKLVLIAGDPATLAPRIIEGLRPWSRPS